MIEKLVDFYIEKTSLWKTVFSKMKARSFAFFLSPIIISLYPLIAPILPSPCWQWISIIIVALPFLVTGYAFNQGIKAKLRLSKKNGILWNSTKNLECIRANEIELISGYLKSRDCLNPETISIFTEKLQKNASKPRMDFPGFPLAIGAILYPIWDKYLAYLFDVYKSPDHFNDLVRVVSISVLLLIMFLSYWIVVSTSVKTIWDEIINRKSKKMVDLVRILEDIEIELLMKK